MDMMMSQPYPFFEDAYPFYKGPAKNGSLPGIEDLNTVSLTDFHFWQSQMGT